VERHVKERAARPTPDSHRTAGQDPPAQNCTKRHEDAANTEIAQNGGKQAMVRVANPRKAHDQDDEGINSPSGGVGAKRSTLRVRPREAQASKWAPYFGKKIAQEGNAGTQRKETQRAR